MAKIVDPLAAKIKQEMAVQGKSIDLLADRLNLSTSTLYKRLAHPGLFTVAELVMICRVLNMRPHEVVKDYVRF